MQWAAVSGFGKIDKSPAEITFAAKTNETEVPNDAIRTWYLLSIMNGCSTIGRLSSAWVSDYWGALNVHAGVTFIASLLVLLLWTLANSTEAAVAFVAIFGTISGAVVSMPAASIAYILGPRRRDRSKLWPHGIISYGPAVEWYVPVLVRDMYDRRHLLSQA